MVREENGYMRERFHSSMLVYSYCQSRRPLIIQNDCEWFTEKQSWLSEELQNCKTFSLERFAVYSIVGVVLKLCSFVSSYKVCM